MKGKQLGAFLIFLLIFINGGYCGKGFENYYTPHKSIKDYLNFYKDKVEVVEASRLKNAQVVLVNYMLIERDFPMFKNVPHPIIDEWLLSELAFIRNTQLFAGKGFKENNLIKLESKYASKEHREQKGFDSRRKLIGKIATTKFSKVPELHESIELYRDTQGKKIKKKAYVPPFYGRAFLMEVSSIHDPQNVAGVVDAKGTGAESPKLGDHSSGVLSLGEALKEYIFSDAVRRVLAHTDSEFNIVGIYAILYTGFNQIDANGNINPLGIILRQASFRPSMFAEKMDNKAVSLYERLAQFGIDPGFNLQLATPKAIIDFGHFIINKEIEIKPLIRGNEIITTTMVPDKDIAIPFDQWGYDTNIPLNPKVNWFYADKDKPYQAGHEIARKYLAILKGNEKNNNMARDMVWREYFIKFIDPVREKLKRNPW